MRVLAVVVVLGSFTVPYTAEACKHHRRPTVHRVHYCRQIHRGLVFCPAPIVPTGTLTPPTAPIPLPVVPVGTIAPEPSPEPPVGTDKEYEEATEEIPSCTPPDCEEQTPPVVEVE